MARAIPWAEGHADSATGRIVAVADVFDALTSERPYKRAWSLDDACRFAKKGAGKHFDPCASRPFWPAGKTSWKFGCRDDESSPQI